MWEERYVPIAILVFWLVCIFLPRQFAVTDFPYVPTKDISSELMYWTKENISIDQLRPNCPHFIQGNLEEEEKWVQNIANVSFNIENNEEEIRTEKQMMDFASSLFIQKGGKWSPKDCNPIHHVALIVPYRNRSLQLQKFIFYMHPFLQKQKIHYQIFIIEQVGNSLFNRGKLLNIGFMEAVKKGWGPRIFMSKTSSWGCFVFHDVDLLPEKLNNIYACTHRPRHMSVAVDSMRYTLLYENLFGGVVAITGDQFKSVNGFSNKFFGWGGEDDDFMRRLEEQQLTRIRFSPSVGSYKMIPHKKEAPSSDRFLTLTSGPQRFQMDGLSNLFYKIDKYSETPLYTNILVNL